MIKKLSFIVPLLAITACSETGDTESERESGNQAEVLSVAAEFSDDTFRLHYRLEVPDPSWYHQYWVYENGDWVRYGSGSDGPDEHGLYEDRISMMLDDGSVEGFSRYGGWMLVHPGMRSLDSAVDSEEVAGHPVLGEQMGRSDVRKYLPQSRNYEDPGADQTWDQVKDEDELVRLQEEGVFLDLWQWRAHRSNPVGYADNGYVLHYRLSSDGTSMYRTNAGDTGDQPAYMYAADQTGFRALDFTELRERAYSQDDYYYLSENIAEPFDPDHDWQEGDTIPYRLLQQPAGARGAITADGQYRDGAWHVTLERSLASPNPLDSKELTPGEVYDVAFAVHHGAVGARHHHVSMPVTLGLGEDAGGDIQATFASEPLAPDELNWTELELIYPGQVNWQWLNSNHPGAPLIRMDVDISVDEHHSYLPLLQEYIERHERQLQGSD